MTWVQKDYAEAWHLRHVPRWIAITSNRHQSVAEHEHGVLVITKMLLAIHRDGHIPEFRLEVFESAIGHDREESITGDHPSPTKAPKDPNGMTQAQILVKCADILEALAFLQEEMLLGNQRLGAVWEDVEARFEGWFRHFGLDRDTAYRYNLVSYEEAIGFVMNRLGLAQRPGFPLLMVPRGSPTPLDEEIPF